MGGGGGEGVRRLGFCLCDCCILAFEDGIKWR